MQCEIDELNALHIKECEAAQEANEPCTMTSKTLIDVQEAEVENHYNQTEFQLSVKECEGTPDANEPCSTYKTSISVEEAEKIETLTTEVEKMKVSMIRPISLQLFHHSSQTEFQLSVKECEAAKKEGEPCYITNKAMFSGQEAEKIETLTEEVEKLKVLLIYPVSLSLFFSNRVSVLSN